MFIVPELGYCSWVLELFCPGWCTSRLGLLLDAAAWVPGIKLYVVLSGMTTANHQEDTIRVLPEVLGSRTGRQRVLRSAR